MRCDARENASDISCLQMTSFSKGSLENEPDVDVGALGSDLVKASVRGAEAWTLS